MPRMIQAYEIIEPPIGVGGMGVVYRAKHTFREGIVAVKVLGHQFTYDQMYRDRLQQEAEALGILQHPNVVRILDFLETPHVIALVMEYVEGRTLSSLIGQTAGAIPFEYALPMIKQILAGMAFSHKNGIVHRDIKPSNIMLTQSGLIKIMDFGIAKITGGKTVTQTGAKMGTLYYMSPEQVHESKHIDMRSDVYSLGMTFFEMLAGRLPFPPKDAVSDLAVMNIISRGITSDPRDYCPNIPEWVVRIIKKSISVKKEDRFADAAEFAAVIERGEAGGDSCIETTIEMSRAFPSYENAPTQYEFNTQTPIPNKPLKSKKYLITAASAFGAVLVIAIIILFALSNQDGEKTNKQIAENHTGKTTSRRESQDVQKPRPVPPAGFVYVEGGTFQMGSTTKSSENPIHSVTLGDLFVGKFEVTVQEFTQFTEATGYRTAAEDDGWSIIRRDNVWEKAYDIDYRYTPFGELGGREYNSYPVVHVCWYDAIEYCNWKSRKDGLVPVYSIDKSRRDLNNYWNDLEFPDYYQWVVTADWNANGYRLPTEAEWEFTARGGLLGKGCMFSGSSNANDAAWFSENSDGTTHPAGLKQPNELGIYDMSGNACELCWDWYNENYYGNSSDTNPKGPISGATKVARGGSWIFSQNFCRVSDRNMTGPHGRNYVIGFRVARSVK